MDYRYIYLVFSKTGTWLSKAINVFSDTKYVHASLSLDYTFKKMYSFGRTNPDNPFSGGLVEESIYDGVYKKYTGSECLIYRVKITEEQFNSLKNEIECFMKEKDKYSYNFIGLFAVLLNMPLKRKNHYFCSQFVSELLINSSIYDTELIPELVKTSDLLLIENKELIYEGFINKYYIFQELYSFS